MQSSSAILLSGQHVYIDTSTVVHPALHVVEMHGVKYAQALCRYSMPYVVTPTAGIYIVLFAVLLHSISSLETVAEDVSHSRDGHVTSSPSLAVATLPSTDARSVCVVLHSMVAHHSMSHAEMYR